MQAHLGSLIEAGEVRDVESIIRLWPLRLIIAGPTPTALALCDSR
jgi:hypothetical protein